MRENGARIVTNFDAETSFYDPNRRIWTICWNRSSDRVKNVQRPASILAGSVVNAAGIMTDLVQAGRKDCNPPLTGEPGVAVVSTRSSWRTKSRTLRIQSNQCRLNAPRVSLSTHTNRSVNPNVADELTTFALRLIPDSEPQRQPMCALVSKRCRHRFERS